MMNPILRSLACALGGVFCLGTTTLAQEAAPTGPDLAARLNGTREDGNTYVRWKLDTAAGAVQLEGKERNGGAEAVYRVLWPKERKGEAVLLRRGGGARFTPPDRTENLSAGQMDEPFFGSALAYADLVENFFAWPQQQVVGTETVNRVNCVILESKPARGASIYGSVKSWIDVRRLVPLRVEKYNSSGALVRRIDTTKVATDDRRQAIPANLTVRGPGGRVSEVDGSKIKHGVAFKDREFTAEGLKDAASGE